MPRRSKRRYIRLGWEGQPQKAEVNVCEHITLPTASDVTSRSEIRDCEYMQYLRLSCKVCSRDYDLTVLVG